MANTKITNHIVDSTVITGQSAVTVADGDYILVSDASDSNALKKVLASDLIQSSEEISDIVGAMVSSNTESGITVAYEDSDNTLDFTIGTLNQNTTGSAATLTTARTIGGTSFDGSANIAVGLAATATALATSRTIHGVGFDGTANIDLSEVISDTVGAMFSSNTETNITVTYQDSDNTIDLVVDAAQPNVTSLGTLTALQVDDININGSTITDAGDLIFDVGGTIDLNSDSGQIKLSDAGVQVGLIQMDSGNNLIFRSMVSDEDMLFKGNDNGSTITALTLDMSASGNALFGSDVRVNDSKGVRLGDSQDFALVFDGTNSNVTAAGNLTLDVVGDIILDAAGNDIILKDNGTTFGQFTNDSGQLIIYNAGSQMLKGNTGSNALFVAGVTASTSAKITQVAITSSSNAVAWDATAAANAYHVTTENTTFSAPSNAVEGAIISVEIAQGGTARTIAWNTVFEFAASTAPTITATANKTDILAFRYNGSVWQEIGRVQNMAQT